MPDPRFDGSLDAPSFVDHGGCGDCGLPASHPNHDSRNEDGHFFNNGVTVLSRERVAFPRPMSRAWLDAAVTRGTKTVIKSIAPEPATLHHAPPTGRREDLTEPQVALPSQPSSFSSSNEAQKQEEFDATDESANTSDEPAPTWQAAIDAVAVVPADACGSAFVAAALRHAPEPVTATALTRIISWARSESVRSSVVYGGLQTLYRQRLVTKDEAVLRDSGGTNRKQAVWRATHALRTQPDVNVQIPKPQREALHRTSRNSAEARASDVYDDALFRMKERRDSLQFELRELERVIESLENLVACAEPFGDATTAPPKVSTSQ